jgi:hypothetical protein
MSSIESSLQSSRRPSKLFTNSFLFPMRRALRFSVSVRVRVMRVRDRDRDRVRNRDKVIRVRVRVRVTFANILPKLH